MRAIIILTTLCWGALACHDRGANVRSDHSSTPDTLAQASREVHLPSSHPIQVVEPIGVIKESDEHVLVGDAFSHRVVRFDTAGKVVGTFGHARATATGILGFGGLLLATPQVAVVKDFRTQEIVGLSLEDGTEVGRWPYHGRLAAMLEIDQDTWLYASPDYGNGMTLGLSEAFGPLESPRFFAAPDAYRNSEAVRSIFDIVSIASNNDEVIIAFSAMDSLWTVEVEDTGTSGAIEVPVRFRRGTGAALDAFHEGSLSSFTSMFEALSVAVSVGMLSDGHRAIVHFDQYIDDARAITAEIFVSVYNPMTREWCVDVRIPTQKISRPEVGFSGDLLLVMDRVMMQEDSRPITRYREYDLGILRCPDQHRTR